jgi:ATP-binding cassette subfamily F protein uup
VPAKPRGDRLSWKEQRELEALPGRIASLEAEQKAVALKIEDPTLYAAQPQEAKRLAGRLAGIDAELISLLERWEALEAKRG